MSTGLRHRLRVRVEHAKICFSRLIPGQLVNHHHTPVWVSQCGSIHKGHSVFICSLRCSIFSLSRIINHHVFCEMRELLLDQVSRMGFCRRKSNISSGALPEHPICIILNKLCQSFPYRDARFWLSGDGSLRSLKLCYGLAPRNECNHGPPLPSLYSFRLVFNNALNNASDPQCINRYTPEDRYILSRSQRKGTDEDVVQAESNITERTGTLTIHIVFQSKIYIYDLL